MQQFKELMAAIREGKSLPRALEQITDINACDEKSLSPLMLACEVGNIDAVKILLATPTINVNQDNGSPNYETPLLIAINSNSLHTKEIVKLLIEQSSLEKKSLNRALIYFAASGDLENLEECLKKGADINAEYLQNTALTEATQFNHSEVVKRLLQESNINVNQTNYRGDSALVIAIRNKNKALIDIFIKHKNCKFDQISPLFGTPLTAAIFFKLYDTADQLISQDPDFQPDKHPAALNWAIRHQSITLTKQLIDRGASINSLGNINYPTSTELPNWLWQEVESDESPFYPNHRNPVFELPVLLALKTKYRELIELILPKVDWSKLAAHQKVKTFIDTNRDELEPEILKLVEQKLIASPKISQINKYFIFNNSIGAKIQGELLESFTEIILGELEALVDISDKETRDLLIDVLFDPNKSVAEVVKYASELDPAFGKRFAIIYCCMYKEEKSCRWKELPQWMPPDTTVRHYYYEFKNNKILKEIKKIISSSSVPEKRYTI